MGERKNGLIYDFPSKPLQQERSSLVTSMSIPYRDCNCSEKCLQNWENTTARTLSWRCRKRLKTLQTGKNSSKSIDRTTSTSIMNKNPIQKHCRWLSRWCWAMTLLPWNPFNLRFGSVVFCVAHAHQSRRFYNGTITHVIWFRYTLPKPSCTLVWTVPISSDSAKVTTTLQSEEFRWFCFEM